MQYTSMLSRILFILGCLGTAIIALPTERDPPTLYRTVGYYTEWAQYARKFPPHLIKENQLTHMLYAFANIRPDTGEVYFEDGWGTTQVRYIDHGDSWNHNDYVYGNVKQLFLKKQANRKLKNLLSIGGWGWSAKFVQPASTEQGRQMFAESAVKLLADNGFDGLDIDWEYPENDEQAKNWVLLLEATRKKLDEHSAAHANGYHFLLTVASPAGPEKYERLHLAEMDKYLDFWNLMAYDYAGSWDKNAGHTSNLHASTSNSNSTPFNTDQAIDYYTSHGVASNKIVLGMPLYGRGFANTEGPGTPYQGLPQGTWEAGIWDYKQLPLPGSEIRTDDEVAGSWSFDPVTKVMVSYDTPDVADRKARYIKDRGLGGGMWWEISGDKEGSDSLIQRTIDIFGGPEALERSENYLDYPTSMWPNLRDKFPPEPKPEWG